MYMCAWRWSKVKTSHFWIIIKFHCYFEIEKTKTKKLVSVTEDDCGQTINAATKWQVKGMDERYNNNLPRRKLQDRKGRGGLRTAVKDRHALVTAEWWRHKYSGRNNLSRNLKQLNLADCFSLRVFFWRTDLPPRALHGVRSGLLKYSRDGNR